MAPRKTLLRFLNKYLIIQMLYTHTCIDFTLSNSYNLFYKVSPNILNLLL